MRPIFSWIWIPALIALCAWLYGYDVASRPGPLKNVHADVGCEDCHIPWKGVENEMCLQCHDFGGAERLMPQIRFHEAGERCLDCHTEHRGENGQISFMEHGLLHPDLACTVCHVDPHKGRFHSDCRACHGLQTWRVAGFRHPPDEEGNCRLCHAAPLSHRHEEFWRLIVKDHYMAMPESEPVAAEDCGRCHITHRWDHLRMAH